MARSNVNNCQFVTPPPAQLYAITEPGDEDLVEKLRAFLSGVKYIIILTLMLWWLPIVGQCVAGYIGGRRAGSAYRGFLASMIPVLLFMLLSYLLNGNPVPRENPVLALAGQVGPSVESLLPFLIPYLNFSALYLGDFMTSLQGTALLEVTLYTVVIVFAFLGGLMADQTKREFRTLLKAVSPIQFKEDQKVWTKYYSDNKGPSFDKYQKVSNTPAKRKPSSKSTGKKAGAAKKKATTTKN